jgi:hypothetical protein
VSDHRLVLTCDLLGENGNTISQSRYGPTWLLLYCNMVTARRGSTYLCGTRMGVPRPHRECWNPEEDSGDRPPIDGATWQPWKHKAVIERRRKLGEGLRCELVNNFKDVVQAFTHLFQHVPTAANARHLSHPEISILECEPFSQKKFKFSKWFHYFNLKRILFDLVFVFKISS